MAGGELMKTALAGLGIKTHYVSDAQLKRSFTKTLCGQQAYTIFDGDGLATGSDGKCKRCEASKRNIQMRAARQ